MSKIPQRVSCEWLKSVIDKGAPEDVVIVDVSWSSKKDCHEDYKSEHIPGARFLNVMEADHSDLFPRNIPSSDIFERNVQEAGVNNESHVIIYSDSDNAGYFMSGRAWWTFRIYGHDKVSILDGGLKKWKNLGYTTVADLPQIKKGNFKAKWTPRYYKKLEDVKENLNSEQFQVCDSRSPSAYTGQDSSGHLKGALNLPYGLLIDQDNLTLKSHKELIQVFKESGLDLTKPIVFHCNSGMSSCTLAFVAETCGIPHVAVYHGGFTEIKSKIPECIEK